MEITSYSLTIDNPSLLGSRAMRTIGVDRRRFLGMGLGATAGESPGVGNWNPQHLGQAHPNSGNCWGFPKTWAKSARQAGHRPGAERVKGIQCRVRERMPCPGVGEHTAAVPLADISEVLQGCVILDLCVGGD